MLTPQNRKQEIKTSGILTKRSKKRNFPLKSSTTSKLTSKSLESIFYTHTHKKKNTTILHSHICPYFCWVSTTFVIGKSAFQGSDFLQVCLPFHTSRCSLGIPSKKSSDMAKLPIFWDMFLYRGLCQKACGKIRWHEQKKAKLNLDLTLLSLTQMEEPNDLMVSSPCA